MARDLSTIYDQAVSARNEYLSLTEIKNSSKMSILDSFTWVVAACIWAFENILDVFKVDVAKDLQNRINGTPAYYANALLKYQKGDQLEMNEEGTAFSYPNVTDSEDKRIITKVSYSEYSENGYYDKTLLLKIATGEPGDYHRIEEEDMAAIRAYMHQISFAGTHLNIVSRNGDVLIPRVTVYYDGAATSEEVYDNIEAALKQYIEELDFNGVVYVQKIIDAIQSAEHVVDVYYSDDPSDNEGVFVAKYDDDNNLIEVDGGGSYEHRIDRYYVPNSGFLKESSQALDTPEETLPLWRETITLTVESIE